MQNFKVVLILKVNKAKGATEEEKMKSVIPIYLCISIDSNRTYKATGYSVERKHWDINKEAVKNTHKLAAHINAGLTTGKST